KNLEPESVHCCVTSPPYYGLRDYGVNGQIGLEDTPEAYVAKLVDVFQEVKRVLRDDGTLWLNLGDSYGTGTKAERTAGSRGLGDSTQEAQDAVPRIGGMAKQLLGIPWRVAFALQADGWYLRQDIIWAKPNPMPESVKDRCTKSHEYIFLLTKSARYFYDQEAVREQSKPWIADRKDGQSSARVATLPGDKRETKVEYRKYAELKGANRRSVWTITTKPFKEAHFATFPEEIPRTCILAGSKKGDTILDPFSGAGTTGVVAEKLGRDYILIELNPKYIEMADNRTWNVAPLFRTVK
ncbi:MAG: site-specific DNA-methyltransferase, partial [Sphaerochaetaceae bacterium]|nr:site-specific DNA-methyltransferase [Sphaerochaetaceae bacterium]